MMYGYAGRRVQFDQFCTQHNLAPGKDIRCIDGMKDVTRVQIRPGDTVVLIGTYTEKVDMLDAIRSFGDYGAKLINGWAFKKKGSDHASRRASEQA